MEKGKLKEKFEIARNLKTLRIPYNQISQATSLTKEEIEKL
jgi:hypothetical protein